MRQVFRWRTFVFRLSHRGGIGVEVSADRAFWGCEVAPLPPIVEGVAEVGSIDDTPADGGSSSFYDCNPIVLPEPGHGSGALRDEVHLFQAGGRLFKLKCRNIVPPSLGTRWASTLHDFDPDDLNPSKTGDFDESAIIDLLEWAWLGPAVFELTRGRLPDDPLFLFTPLELGREMQSVARDELGTLPPPVLYVWRHTAASVEFLEKLRTLNEVSRRGRWKSDSSVRRYEKGGRIGEEFARLPQATRDFAKSCHPLLRRVLCGKLRAPRPPAF